MRSILRSIAVLGLTVAGLVLAGPGTADAAPSTVAYDVSFPQCGSPLPSGQPFGVVGVNGGTAVSANPCLSTQLRWAAGSTGALADQPRVQLYLNTANPGQVIDQVTTWPTSGTNRYGSCDGSNSAACSYQYGVERATYSVRSVFGPAARAAGISATVGSYTWWLDVETSNTWQDGSTAALARNRAALEGMTDFLTSSGGRVGIYSIAGQWRQVVGTVPSASSLTPLPSWLAGASTLSGAIANCAKAPLTQGPVMLAQYVVGGLDRDRSCS
jgi:hypothetical protein